MHLPHNPPKPVLTRSDASIHQESDDSCNVRFLLKNNHPPLPLGHSSCEKRAWSKIYCSSDARTFKDLWCHHHRLAQLRFHRKNQWIRCSWKQPHHVSKMQSNNTSQNSSCCFSSEHPSSNDWNLYLAAYGRFSTLKFTLTTDIEKAFLHVPLQVAK